MGLSSYIPEALPDFRAPRPASAPARQGKLRPIRLKPTPHQNGAAFMLAKTAGALPDGTNEDGALDFVYTYFI